MTCFLYEMRSPSGKSYIGISEYPEYRWAQHAWAAARGSRLPVHSAIRKYGMDGMSPRVIAVGPVEYIRQLEISVIQRFDARVPTGYNVTYGGETSPSKAPEVRAAIGRAAKKNWQDPVYAAKIKASSTGRKMTPEQNAKNSAAKRDHWQRPGYRENMVAKHTGKTRSPESIAKAAMSIKATWDRGRIARIAKMTGRRWVNDGVKNIQLRAGESAPSGTFEGMVRK